MVQLSFMNFALPTAHYRVRVLLQIAYSALRRSPTNCATTGQTVFDYDSEILIRVFRFGTSRRWPLEEAMAYQPPEANVRAEAVPLMRSRAVVKSQG